MPSGVFRLPESLKGKLKQPLGHLIPESTFNNARLLTILAPEQGQLIVSVGDRTTERLIEAEINPQLQIVDGIERRVPRQKPVFTSEKDRILQAENPPGTITNDSLSALSSALKMLAGKNSPVRIEINGEEDLLVLPILAFFPENTIVAYGQPGEGIVIVNAIGPPRNLATSLLSEVGIGGLPD